MGEQKGPAEPHPPLWKRRPVRLLAAGVLTVGLTVGVLAVAGVFGGEGGRSVPSGDVAIVKKVPSDISNVSEAEFKRAVLQ